MKESKLKKFSLFALNQETALPIVRMPFYAEVGVRSTLEPPAMPPDDRFDDPIDSALIADDACRNDGQRQCKERVTEVLRELLSRLLSPETRDQLAADNNKAMAFLSRVILRVIDTQGAKTLLGLDINTLKMLFDNALRAEAEGHGFPPAAPAAPAPIVWAHPMGILATDHTGYLSFDLTRLPDTVYRELLKSIEARRLDPEATLDTTIWVYPMAREEHRFNALAQGRIAHDAILLKLQLPEPELPEVFKNFGFLSMQNPDLTDWRFSPGSFATNPGSMVGADGCETILPANNALHEFNFHQVIGIPAADVDLPIDAAAAGKVRPGFINEYRLSFVPIGHSLGQILYSFPLAPGESVNLAVIDWTRRDSALRNESTKLDESLVHELRRDRIITETVRASIDEWQHGGSLMGGLAASAGGAMGGAGTGLAAGYSAAIGGGYSTTSGSRDIAADTVQTLSDNVAQASASSRELHSTVVVQSSQAEHEAIETRTVVNYNHSHALTILYYEVLRHFRLVTEFVRRRPALLTNIHGGITHLVNLPNGKQRREIYWPAIYENRKLLAAALLDDRYKEHFDIVERRRHRERIAEVVGPPPAAPKPLPPQGPAFRFFTFEIRTGDVVPVGKEDVHIRANIDLNVAPLFIKLNNGNRISPAGTFYEKGHLYSFVAKTEGPDRREIFWGEIEAIAVFVHLEGFKDDHDMSFSFLRVTGTDVDGVPTILYEKDYVPSDHLIFDTDITMFLPTRRPAPRPLPPGRPAEEIEEEAKFKEFEEHLLNNRPHYERALRLGTPPALRAFELANLAVGGGASLLEKVDNRPLEVLGDFVAYPCTDPVWSDKIMEAMKNIELELELPDPEPVERLITLPTRGVFAEAKLGHCNASEEIDNTRFWDWQTSPIPHLAPEIAPITGVTPQSQQQNLGATPFPQSLVNIVNPPNAPDPTGLAAALNVLATPNIFRDMSGRAEVADLLKKLSDNSVSIAQAASEASRIQTKYGSNLQGLGSGGSLGTGGSGSGSPRARPTEPSMAIRDLQDTRRELQGAQKDNFITPKEGQDMYKGKALLAFGLDASAAESGGGMVGSSVSPFSEKLYPTEMQPSATHNERLANALKTVRDTLNNANQTRLDNVSIFVVKLTPSGRMDYAGVRETEMFFSGSLLKVALLYASFELVARVNELASPAGSVKDFFAKVSQDFDPKIANAIPKITPGPWRKVQFDQALAATEDAPGKFRVKLSPQHDKHLRSIFSTQGQNDGARECMHRLGFSYVNGALEAAGFLGLAGETGIWMATDFVEDNPPGTGNWPSFNVPVVTNGTSSAAMTTLTMANLLKTLHRRELIDATSSQTMRDIFATSGAWLSTLANPNAFSFTAEGAKVGHSASASARVSTVMSEAAFLKRKSDSAPFVAVWQNVPDPLGAEPIYQVIDDLVKNWP